MYQISDHQIDYILEDLRSRGIRIDDLQQNLLDHICILIEENLGEGGDFEQYYQSLITSFYRDQLSEIEEETQFLLKHPRRLGLLSRVQFFILLFVIFIGPIIGAAAFNLSQSASNTPGHILKVWEGAFVFALFPLTSLLVLFLTPERFDPLIPRGAKILLGWRPMVTILPPVPGAHLQV